MSSLFLLCNQMSYFYSMRYLIGTVLIMIGWMAEAQLRFVAADSEAFTYSGRFDKTIPGEVSCDWPGASVVFQFTGETLELCMDGGERNYYGSSEKCVLL